VKLQESTEIALAKVVGMNQQNSRITQSVRIRTKRSGSAFQFRFIDLLNQLIENWPIEEVPNRVG
jgi:hypothetical protein